MAEKYVLDINNLGNMDGFEPFYVEEPESSEEPVQEKEKEIVPIITNSSNGSGDGEIIDEETQESVDNEDKPSGDEGNSPDFYNSIATSLVSDGVLSLPEEEIKAIKTAEDLSAAFKKQAELQLSEENKRVLEALDLGVPKEEIAQVERMLGQLANITDTMLSEETDDANVVRQNIIYQDHLNNGIPADKAKRLVKQSLDEGTDVEDAIKALESNKSFFLDKRKGLIEAKKAELKSQEESNTAKQEKIKNLFLEKEEPIKGMKLSKTQRENLYNKATKVVGKNKEGKFLTELEKYAETNPEDYQYNLNILFYLTNGFKDLGSVISKEVNEQTKSKLRDLDKALKTPSGQSSLDNLKFGNDTSPDSTDDGFSIDLR